MSELGLSRRVSVLGAGPVGVEAAHALSLAGHDVHVYERGGVGDSVRAWGHVRLFSPWALNTSEVGRSALADVDVPTPDPDVFPTGSEYVRQYLAPLSDHPRLAGRVHTQTQVIEVGRGGLLKGQLLGSSARRDHPFRLLVENGSDERVESADVIIDATGCFGNPNRLGDGGVLAPGERRAAEKGNVVYGLPPSAEFGAGNHTMIVGAGYSAATTLKMLLDRGDQRVTWLTLNDGEPYVRVDNDPLPQRDVLALLGNAIARGEYPAVTHIGGAAVDSIESGDRCLVTVRRVESGERVEIAVDKVVASVGFRPDWSLVRELQFHQCWGSEGPMKLAAALLGASGGGDCLAQASHGADTLRSPEPDFFVLGAKSYGRNSSFLIKLGLEQVDDVITLVGRVDPGATEAPPP